TPILNNFRLMYAVNGEGTGRLGGSRGCLRDSQGNVEIFEPNGLNFPLHNWALITDRVITL
ncbi:hypothetical protein, partial [Mucilaginibacter gynuensis]|uniref:hypothetical protein n=1 Tax=Mucilaginibacter gynuensis TaxID=1302236 RepID=UPI0031E73DF6